MESNAIKVDPVLSALGVNLSAEFLSRLGIEKYLDQLDHVVKLDVAERQQFADLLRSAQNISSTQLTESSDSAHNHIRNPDKTPFKKDVLAQLENDVVHEFQRRQTGGAAVSGKFALGNILVASGDISRTQLELALLHQVVSGCRLGEELISSGLASKVQVDRGLLMQLKLIAFSLAVTVALSAIAPPAEATQKSASMPVSVTVIANAKIQIDHQTSQIKISAENIALGYVEILSASRFSVITNSRSGYRIELHPVGNLFESVQVSGVGNTVLLGADGGEIVHRGTPQTSLVHDLSFRFSLRPDTQPGNYPWPLQLSVSALR